MSVSVVVGDGFSGVRLDKALAEICPVDMSRSRIKSLIEDGCVRVNGRVCLSASSKVDEGFEVEIDIPDPVDDVPVAQQIDIDIVYEDDDLLVINKPAGLVVHPGAGNHDGTLVNALLYHCEGSLSGIGGVKRPGIVHRLDKDTSGLMVVAKHDAAHKGLSSQLADRSLSRVYQGFLWKVPVPVKGKVDAPLGRHKTNRVRMDIRMGVAGREAITNYLVKESYGGVVSIAECSLETGRTHQIRVHMRHIGFPLIGDPLYGLPDQEGTALLRKAGMDSKDIEKVLKFGRQALHAGKIGFYHPVSEEYMEFSSELPEDLMVLESVFKTMG